MSPHEFKLTAFLTSLLALVLVYFSRRGEWQVIRVGSEEEIILRKNLTEARARRIADRLAKNGGLYIAEPMMRDQLG